MEVKSEEGAGSSTWWITAIGEVKEEGILKMTSSTSTGTGMLCHDKEILSGVDR